MAELYGGEAANELEKTLKHAGSHPCVKSENIFGTSHHQDNSKLSHLEIPGTWAL